MIRYKELEQYLVQMMTTMIGNEYINFKFSDDPTNRVIVERQNSAPMPDTATVMTLRVDNYNNWKAQRYGRGTIYYDRYGGEHIGELRSFKCYVNIMSKELGDAFDAARFVIANLQNNRYNEFVWQNGRLLGIENVSSLKNLSDLENGTWTERVYFELDMTMKEEILVNDPTLFVKTPATLADVPNSVEIETEFKN